jgi:ferritin-like protein
MESKYRQDCGGSRYWDGTPEEQAAYDAWYAKQVIYERLASLDLKVPRGLEDLIIAQGIDVTILPQVTQDILAEKQTLRSNL